jgi:hypothetical protein
MRGRRIFLGAILIVVGMILNDAAMAQTTIPPVWNIVSEDFESGSLGAWSQTAPGNLSLIAGGGRSGSTGLSVAIGQNTAYISQASVAYAVEGYLTFWFNPNNVALPEPTPNYWPPGTSLCVAEVRSSASDWWPPLVGFYLRKPPGQGYKGYLALPRASGYVYDYQNGQFDLANGWQKITLGYRIDTWVAVWVNDTLVRSYTSDVVHDDPSGDVIEIGKVNTNSTTPTGSIRLDDVAFQVPRVNDLWVNSNGGNDDNNGRTSATAFRTIQKAAALAGPGTTVHILPGVYRETVSPALDGSPTEPVLYRAENGAGTVALRGSEPASSLTWTQLSANTIGLPPGVNPANIYFTDLSAWNLTTAPRFVAQLDSGGNVTARLPLAREPDWQVATEWKTHEFWWAADGGVSPVVCDPVTNADHNCDLAQRSMTQLTDRTNDADPAGVEPGNLTTLGDLTGATLVAIDTLQGHYVYRRTITAHDVGAGRITVDRVCEHDSNSGNPGLGWGSKYYVEGKPRLLDTPGEWWYDATSKRLYLWSPTSGNPAALNIEISRRDDGFRLNNRSYTTLDGLTIELANRAAFYQVNWTNQKSYRNLVRNVRLRYANYGAYIEQDVSASAPAANITDGFTLQDSEIAYIDSQAIRLIDWWENDAAANSFARSGIRNTIIRNNTMHHLGFRTDGDNAIGASFTFANKLRFEGNHIHHVAHNGVQFSKSVIQSSKTYGFAPGEIKTGEILIKDNIFEKACQLTTDCGGLKFWGSSPDNHVYRDVLITGNIFRDTFGWTYVSEKRQRWMGGTSSQVRGTGGFGLYMDHASGFHVYRNIAYNNAYTGYMFSGVWRDGDMVYYNNVAANSLYGMSIGSSQYDTHGAVNTQIANNILVNNEGFGISLSYATGHTANTIVDNNLYYNNGWRPSDQGGMYKAGVMVVREGSGYNPIPTLAELQANTVWEDHGVTGDPAFSSYNVSDHDLHDGSTADFHLTSGSTNAMERGTSALPTSLTALLNGFGVNDYRRGTAYDIGRYEAGFAISIAPTTQAIAPSGTARYTVRLDPSDLAQPVTLAFSNPSPHLTINLTPAIITGSGSATLIVTDTHSGQQMPGLSYVIPITGAGGGFTQSSNASLLVGGARSYLPSIQK